MATLHALLKSAALACLLIAASGAQAQNNPGPGCATARDGSVVCPKADARCMPNRYGDILCSTPGGGIEANRYGDLVCGPGYCTKDALGEVNCSSSPRGAAALDRYGAAVCSDSCVKASASVCVKPGG